MLILMQLEIMKGILETNNKIDEIKDLLEEKLNRIIELIVSLF